MRKFYLAIASCVALVAFMGFSATAYSANIVDPDCDGTPNNNDFVVNNFGIVTANSDVAGEVSGMTGSGAACGTVLQDNFLDCGSSPYGHETLNDYALVKSPPGVEVNSTAGLQTGRNVG